MRTSMIIAGTKKGSVLAYSLIVMFMLLSIALVMSKTATMSRQNAITTTRSVQALQIAESGSQATNKQIMSLRGDTTKTITDLANALGGSCNNGTGFVTASMSGGTYSVQLREYDASGNLSNVPNCSVRLNKLKQISVQGTSGGDVTRAIELSVPDPVNFFTVINKRLCNIDISTPSSPQYGGSLVVGPGILGQVLGVSQDRKYVFVERNDAPSPTVRAVDARTMTDVTGASSAVHVGSSTPYAAISGPIMYLIAQSSLNMDKVGVSNPTGAIAPILVNNIHELWTGTSSIRASNNNVLVYDHRSRPDGYSMVNIADATNAKTYLESGSAHASYVFEVSGDGKYIYSFLGDKMETLNVPAPPGVATSVQSSLSLGSGEFHSIKYKEDAIYFLEKNGQKIGKISLADPKIPALVGGLISTGGGPTFNEIFVVNDYLVLKESFRYRIFDVSGGSPVQKGDFRIQDNAKCGL